MPYFLQQRYEFRKKAHNNAQRDAKYSQRKPACRSVDENTLKAYAELYVTTDAPKNVVIAAYKALLFECHPDRGGSEEQAKTINAAKNHIFEVKGW